jgi:hypothetical protein
VEKMRFGGNVFAWNIFLGPHLKTPE